MNGINHLLYNIILSLLNKTFLFLCSSVINLFWTKKDDVRQVHKNMRTKTTRIVKQAVCVRGVDASQRSCLGMDHGTLLHLEHISVQQCIIYTVYIWVCLLNELSVPCAVD